jgi:enterochelin esterase-like enzyme
MYGDYDIDVGNLKKIVMGASMGGLMSIKTGILNPSFENIISLSPAFWFGFPGIVNDLNNLNKKSICNLSVGTKEGNIFGDQVKNIFPKEWDLDFSNNNDFYISGVKKIEEELKLNNIKTNFVFKEKGQHNETHWNPILREFLVSI